jgi:excisionase family DNA binding protein
MLSRVGRLHGSGKTSVCFPNGTEVSLSASLSKVLQFSADELADGNAVTILASDVALSPGEAADLLGLSRPFVVRLLDDGSIPSQTQPQTRHRKVLLSDVSAFQAQRARKRAGRQRIMKIVEGNDLPY